MGIDLERIMDELKIAALKFPVKTLAPLVLKEEGTLRNELNEADCGNSKFKVSIKTALRIIENSQRPDAPRASQEAGLAVVDLIEEGLGRIAYVIPKITADLKMTREMRIVGRLTKEFSETIKEIADAIDDGRWKGDELERCLKENKDLLRACLEVDAYLKALGRQKAAPAKAGA